MGNNIIDAASKNLVHRIYYLRCLRLKGMMKVLELEQYKLEIEGMEKDLNEMRASL